jgi:uncharacterized protein with PIN domain
MMAVKGAYAVCEKHGTEVIKGMKKMVRAPIPKSKKQRYEIGCPKCRQEIAQGQ